MGKRDILEWRERALRRIEARGRSSHAGLDRVSPQDVDVYRRSVARHFEALRSAHNMRAIGKPKEEK